MIFMGTFSKVRFFGDFFKKAPKPQKRKCKIDWAMVAQSILREKLGSAHIKSEISWRIIQKS